MSSKGPQTLLEAIAILKNKNIRPIACSQAGYFSKATCKPCRISLTNKMFKLIFNLYHNSRALNSLDFSCFTMCACFHLFTQKHSASVAAEAMASGLALVAVVLQAQPKCSKKALVAYLPSRKCNISGRPTGTVVEEPSAPSKHSKNGQQRAHNGSAFNDLPKISKRFPSTQAPIT